MRTNALSGLVIAMIALTGIIDPVYGCEPLDKSLEDVIADADFVLRGRIIQIKLVGTGNYEHKELTVEVYTYWKDPTGEFAPMIHVYPAESCFELRAQVGDIWTITGWVLPRGLIADPESSWAFDPYIYWPFGLEEALGSPMRVPVGASSVGSIKARY